MADEVTPIVPAKSQPAPVASDSKREKIEAIWATWRNEHLNDALPAASFRTVEDASKHLFDALTAAS